MLFSVFIIAFLLRAAPFLNRDFLFFQDQSRDLLLVKQIVEDQRPILIGSRTGIGGLFHGPLWVYSLIPTFLISHGNPYWTLIPVYLFYSLAIFIVGFFVGWKLYNKWVGLVFAFFLAISQPLIASIYYMTDAHVMPLVFLGYLYCLIKYTRGNRNAFISVVFFAGLGFQFEPAFSVVLIPLTFLAGLIIRKLSFKIILLSIFAFVISVANFIFFDLRHNFLMTKVFLTFANGGLGTLPGYANYQSFGFRIINRLEGSINSYLTPLYSKDLLSVFLLSLVIILSLFILIVNIKNKRKLDKTDREYILLFSFPFILYMPYIFYPYPLWSHYVLPVSTVVMLFVSMSIWRIRNSVFGVLLLVLLIVAALVPVTNSISTSYASISDKSISSDSSYKNQKEVARWILQDSEGKPFNYLVYIPSTLTYGMDYLFSWKKLIGNQVVHSCSKEGLTYLIYYPHLEGDSKAYSYWKKNIIKTEASPILTKKFYGEILVEKFELSQGEKDIDPNYCQNLVFR